MVFGHKGTGAAGTMWPQHKVEVYEQMVAALRSTLAEEVGNIPPPVRARLEGVIEAAVHAIETGPKIVAIGLPDLEPGPAGWAVGQPQAAGPAAAETAMGESAGLETAAAGPATGGLDPAEPVPAPAKHASDPFRHGAYAESNRLLKAKQLARWLWDRNISGEQVLGFSQKWRNKIARAAGVNPPSTLETWIRAVELMERMEQRGGSGARERHHLDEHVQWATER